MPEDLSPDDPSDRRPARHASLALLVAVTMTGTVALHIFVPALAVAAADLGTDAAGIQTTITVYLVGLAGGQLLYGPLSDRYGRRPVLIGGLALYLAGLLLAIPAPNLGILLVARMMQSLGACSCLVIGRAMVRDVSTREDAARKLAILVTAMTLTPALAPAIGGVVSQAFGWRAVFVLLAVVVALLGALVVLTLPETNRHKVALPGIGAVLAGYLRLVRIPTSRAYLVAGAAPGRASTRSWPSRRSCWSTASGARRRKWGSIACLSCSGWSPGPCWRAGSPGGSRSCGVPGAATSSASPPPWRCWRSTARAC
ncbi:MFS transporter [Methylobacterium persicinum]